MPGATPPCVLTIGGTDSGGGAGVAADLRTFAAYGVHGALAVTAVTAQDTNRVHASEPVRASFLAAQIEVVARDLRPEAAKTGYLGSTASVAAVSALAAYGTLRRLVVDPVLVSSSGEPLFTGGDMTAAVRALLTSAIVATPNTYEAALLLGWPPDELGDLAAAEEAARELQSLGPSLVVVTGGRRRGKEAVDVAFDGVAVTHLAARFVETPNVHGSGDVFSAAVAAGLALGWGPLEAALSAKGFVQAAIERSAGWRLGSGHGPVDPLDLEARRAEREASRPGNPARPAAQGLEDDGSSSGAP